MMKQNLLHDIAMFFYSISAVFSIGFIISFLQAQQLTNSSVILLLFSCLFAIIATIFEVKFSKVHKGKKFRHSQSHTLKSRQS